MHSSKQLRRSFVIALLALLAALVSMSAATFAWYIYNTSARTTEVKMSAGSSVSLQIANALTGDYASATVMEDFHGRLNPVSTDKLSGGFQQVVGFDQEVAQNGQTRLFAAMFDSAVERVDYHKTSLFLRTNATSLDIYLSDIGFEDVSDLRPLSTALRLGLVVKQEGSAEYIFEINPNPDPNRGDNADRNPSDTHVLDSTKTDGSTVEFSPLNRENFCDYNTMTGVVTLKPGSQKLFTLPGGTGNDYGTPVEVEIYVWLEGCDRDCTANLVGQTLRKLSVSFAGKQTEGG